MNKKIQLPNKAIQLQVALVPVCKMVIRFGLHFNEFVKNLQKAYIFAAEEILKKSSLKPSLQAIAIKTGIDRRTISDYKSRDNHTHVNPLNKMDMVIMQLQRLCSHTNQKLISVKTLNSTIDSIYAHHIRSNAIIKELVSNEVIKKIDAKTYKLNLTLQQQLLDISLMADEVDYTAKRLFQTYYKNMFETESTTTLIQSTSLSTKIAPSKHATVNQLLSIEIKKTELKIKEIIKLHESNLPEGSYPELGVTQFQFNS